MRSIWAATPSTAGPGVFLRCAPAPLQLSYLGYPGSLRGFLHGLSDCRCDAHPRNPAPALCGADPVPAELSGQRLETVPSLRSFFTRAELGLPARGFVFCCFNNNYKNHACDHFAAWMRILSRVSESVLLLYAGNATVEHNLRSEAVRGGIDPGRLVFGTKLAHPEYLARYRAADLFLDTLPYNAGTTASDALWAGLPVLTCAGESFAGRMAASVLHAVGLPELVTDSLERYEELAVALAQDASRLAVLKNRLTRDRDRSALFDTARFTRRLEQGLLAIHQRYLGGLPPQDTWVTSGEENGSWT